MILTRLIIMCFWPLSVLAQAPLLSRNVNDAVENNWIVVLKHELTLPVVDAYYDTLRKLSKALLGPHRGLRKTFDNVNGLHAFHIECDKVLLETIRIHPNASTHLRLLYTCLSFWGRIA